VSDKVMAAIDDSPVAPCVLSVADSIATTLFRAEVIAAHVKEDGPEGGARRAAQATGAPLTVLIGPTVEALAAEARAPDVAAIVVGSRASPGGARPAGHIALGLLQAVPKPLIVTPPNVAVPFVLKRMLVPLDATPESADAVRSTLALACGCGVDIVVLNVVAPDAIPMFNDQPQHETRAWVEEFLLRNCPPAVDVSVELRAGLPADHVLRVAEETATDLIVLGWAQDLAPGRAMVVKRVVERSTVPVLLLPRGRTEEAAHPPPEMRWTRSTGEGSRSGPVGEDPRRPDPEGSIDAVIFDLDGIVTRTADVHARAWKQLFDEYLEGSEGVDARPFDLVTDYARYVDGKPRDDGVRDFLASRGIRLPEGSPEDPPGAETVHGLGSLKNGYFLEHLRSVGAAAFSSTVRLVRELQRARIGTAVISSSRNASEVLQAAGLADLFEVRVDGTHSDALDLRGKPEPDVFLEAARRLRVEPARAAVVEDALAGVEAGRRGGFALVIAVDRSGLGHELTAAGADIVVRDLSELPATALTRRGSPPSPGGERGERVPEG